MNHRNFSLISNIVKTSIVEIVNKKSSFGLLSGRLEEKYSKNAFGASQTTRFRGARPRSAGACLVNGPYIYNRSVQSEASSQIILAENLVKVYEAGKLWVTAVRGVSLSVQKGEFVAIVGPSGSGKSTLFYLLGGLTRATKGRVVIDGVDFATLDDGERTRLRKHRIGFVFQKFNLLPTLSAMGNIEIAYTISGRKEPMDMQYLDHLSDMLSIQGRLKHRPSELSGGEQQRVAIARALVTQPAIVLADEPTGNLDTRNSEAVLHMLQRSNRELGQTTLMITHNPEAASVAGRILYMRDGQIVREEKGSRSDEPLPVSPAVLPV
jgi:putative ABC transport system ATP-binding protein